MDEHLPQLRLSDPPRRGLTTVGDQRVGELERNQVCDQLSTAYAAGRLDHLELEERLALAVTARTRLDLYRLVNDLAVAAPRRPAAATPKPTWSATDAGALVLLLGCGASIVGLMLMVAAVSSVYFFGAVVGGSLAFVSGACAAQLWRSSVARSRSSAQGER